MFRTREKNPKRRALAYVLCALLWSSVALAEPNYHCLLTQTTKGKDNALSYQTFVVSVSPHPIVFAWGPGTLTLAANENPFGKNILWHNSNDGRIEDGGFNDKGFIRLDPRAGDFPFISLECAESNGKPPVQLQLNVAEEPGVKKSSSDSQDASPAPGSLKRPTL